MLSSNVFLICLAALLSLSLTILAAPTRLPKLDTEKLSVIAIDRHHCPITLMQNFNLAIVEKSNSHSSNAALAAPASSDVVDKPPSHVRRGSSIAGTVMTSAAKGAVWGGAAFAGQQSAIEVEKLEREHDAAKKTWQEKEAEDEEKEKLRKELDREAKDELGKEEDSGKDRNAGKVWKAA